MAKNGVTIEGLGELQTTLKVLDQKLWNLVTITVDEICKAGVIEAQKMITEMKAVDTGALRGSIEGGITEVKPGVSVEGQVGAGSNRVLRGAGSYISSIKTGGSRPVQATSEYAEKVEFGESKTGPRPFMSTTYIYLKQLGIKKFTSILQKALGRI
jgi:hypothetical protein